MSWKVPEKFRLSDVPGRLFSKKGEPFGAFRVESPDKARVTKTHLFIIASPGTEGIDWEHVSVHAVKYFSGKTYREFTPTWEEMCFVKSLFWDDEDRVVQFHPERSKYVNVHQHTLHLYRPTKIEIPLPPGITV